MSSVTPSVDSAETPDSHLPGGTLAAEIPEADPELGTGDVVLLVLDQEIIDAGLQDAIRMGLEHELDVLFAEVVPRARALQTSLAIRRAIAPGYRGKPGALLLMLNLTPAASVQAVWSRSIIRYETIARCRKWLRRFLRKHLPKIEETALYLIFENATEAWKVLATAFPEAASELRQRVRQCASTFRMPYPVIRPLGGRGRRSKVALVDFHGTPAVCKLFRPSKNRFHARELMARRLSDQIQEMPEMLAYGPNWIVTPFYGNSMPYDLAGLRLLPLNLARQVVAMLEKLYDAGYALLDVSLKNVIVDRDAGLKVIDCEFLHQYDRKPARFEESYDVVGVPRGFSEDMPGGMSGVFPSSYALRLQPYIGLSFHSLMHDPLWKQRVKRAGYWLFRFLPRAVAARAKHRMRQTAAFFFRRFAA